MAFAALFLLSTPTATWSMSETLAITDPDDPNFDPEDFRFENYDQMRSYPKGEGWRKDPLTRALVKMFPPGTDRAYVDKILVEQAGALANKNPRAVHLRQGDVGYSYLWPPRTVGGWVVSFIYRNDKSVSMKMGTNLVYGYDQNKGEKQ
jgi:hypothetical protein